MNNAHWHPEHPTTPLPASSAYPGQPTMNLPPCPRPHREDKKLNPYGVTALAMTLLMIALGAINIFFFSWELKVVMPIGFSWLGAMGLAIGALFMKGREKITAIIALVLGVFIVIALPLFYVLVMIFIMWVGGGFA